MAELQAVVKIQSQAAMGWWLNKEESHGKPLIFCNTI